MFELNSIKIYADGADIDGMLQMAEKPFISGFTTNPSLMAKAGVTDYVAFAQNAVEKITDKPLSFEVFSDNFDTMEKEARKIASLGPNVYVKIPVMNSRGMYSYELIRKLSAEGIKLNVTAIFTIDQVAKTIKALSADTPSIVSVFAGRIADTSIDPIDIMIESRKICKDKSDNIELLWASCREVLNIVQAANLGVDIITVPNDILKKAEKYFHKDLEEFSLDTVKGFAADSQKLGFSILD